MKRTALTLLVALVGLLAVAGTASAHVISSLVPDCSGAQVAWTGFPGGPFDLNLAFQDQVAGKAVGSPFVVAHLSGASGSKFVSAPAAEGVTFRKVTATWTADGGGSSTASAYVHCPGPPPTTTVTVTTPGQTVTLPGTTTPGQTVTVTRTVTTPAVTVTGPAMTLTTGAPTVTVTGPTVTVTTPGSTRIVIRHSKPKVIVRWRTPVGVVHCPPGFSGSVAWPTDKKGRPILGRFITHCKAGQRLKGAGVTG